MSDIKIGKIEQLTSGTASGYPNMTLTSGLPPSPIVGPVEYRCPTCDVAIEGRHSCAETRIAELEADLASARNLYAAQEERYERGRKAEDAARERIAKLEAQVAELTADRERLDYALAEELITLVDTDEWGDVRETTLTDRAAIDAARKAAE